MVIFFEIVSKSSSSRFVDDMENVKIRDLIGIFGSLFLLVVEVGGNSDDGVGDFFVEVRFSDFFYFVKNYGRDFFGSELFFGVIDFNLDNRFVIFVYNFVGEVFEIGLDIFFVVFVIDKVFEIC